MTNILDKIKQVKIVRNGLDFFFCLYIKLIGYFEQLPNKILLYLFENYIHLIDVYLAFYFLNNRRINEIINSAHFYIDIPSKELFYVKYFSHLANQIVSLRLSIFSNDDLDLSKLINLRYLHIEKPTHKQSISIQPEILSPCWYSVGELPKHLENINQLCSFKYLHFFILPDGKMIRISLKSDQTSINQ
ncbi:unnamed protein product [Adineta steineri]|uniref:Uncharacterized protein n=1 Tax=Adineta steineri TaxID=433720 RepID=A0A814UW87_9BILA|nr:unnamed protein product [Adineta steineri]CAF1414621.1 unnamed protein product [Adineta steineri]